MKAIENVKEYLRQNDSFLSEFLLNRYYEKREKRNIALAGLQRNKQEGEDLYIAKWKRILRFSSPYAYRLYSQYIGPSENIVSQTAANKINSVLNPVRYNGYLQDKNNFDKILTGAPFPKTIVRKIQGQLYDGHYNAIDDCRALELIVSESNLFGDKVIVKDTIDSDSGRGIQLYAIDNQLFAPLNSGSEVLEGIPILACLKLREDDFVVQEALSQSSFMSQFNPTSINTIRIAVYRSVNDGVPHILSAVIRMGVAGRFIDNLHGGGRMVRIKENGVLDDHCVDQYGRIFYEHNGVNFSNKLVLPDFDKVESLVLELSKQLYDIHLIQWDIAIDALGAPRLVEFNLNGFSMWIAQMTGTPAFGQYTDEIIEYVASKCPL